MNNAAPDGGGGSGSVSIDIDALSAAHSSMTELASRIDSQRHRASSGCPVGLSSLADGSPVARAADWLTEQGPHIQTVLDLARLLDTEGAGSVTYDGSGDFDDTETMLGEEMADRLGDIEINDIGDRERYQELADLIGRYQDNETVNTSMLRDLGPEGVTDAINRLAAMTASPPTNGYWQGLTPPDNPADEQEALGNLQTSMAAALTGMLGKATNNGWFDEDEQEDWGGKLGEQVLASTILLRSADKNNILLGGDLTRSLGHELMEWEHGDQTMSDSLTNPASMFGNEVLADDNANPMLQFVRAADNGPDQAQGVMSDHELAAYLLNGRLTDETTSGMESILRQSTVDSAMDPTNGRSRRAADISSWVIEHAAGSDLPGAYDEELGGILGTYMPDVYRIVDGSDPRQVIGDVPPFEMDVEKGDLTSVLQHISGNDTARSIVGGSSTRLNQLLLDHGAAVSLEGRAGGDDGFNPDTPGDPLVDSIATSSALRGYLEDQFVEGRVQDGEEEAEARQRTAELFTLPIDLIDTGSLGKGGPVADFLIGEVKDQIIKDYVGEPAQSAAEEGNKDYDNARRATTLQAFYSLVTAEGDTHPGQLPGGLESGPDGGTRFETRLHDAWPTENGEPKAPGDLTPGEVERIIDQYQHDPGINSTTSNTVKAYYDAQQPR